jgi:hypothetical protein
MPSPGAITPRVAPAARSAAAGDGRQLREDWDKLIRKLSE